ncbi:dihydroneopterin aldolase family protein [Halorussus gelatinilyticus]|uniref:Dihydroneopterin aldolase n=1 Tax=Halorussus gelatinilyticus TaxID=2937524 RepID=A0A8U0ILV3_9EURY|nr:dihydroneopterin aldolase family protein [Halorussus gelatinilyticus]UPW02117.1 dihydroneopterin aldolase family protein [Halorussus gelatinilyticus]
MDDSDRDQTDSGRTDSDPTDAEEACFEAGIKFGALYHQFAGTPVSPESAPSLETAIEESIENQPFAESVTVEILAEKLREEMTGGYTELTGRFMEVEIIVDHEGVEVVTSMAMEDGYPLMKVESVN